MFDRIFRHMPSSDGTDGQCMDTTAHRLKFKIMQGLYVVTDIYPFHLQARKVELILADSDSC
jgi:hypothetical protein